jgi:hypothetical protein
MKPLKTGLLIVYCLGSLIVLGNSFSHVWRTKKEVRIAEKQIAANNLKISNLAEPQFTTP